MDSQHRTLLLVDDEENILNALTRLLRRDGYRILCASGGQAGLDLLAQHPVGVIISDQRMPGMTGSEFLSHAKTLYPDTVRIVLSGYTGLNAVADAINRGAIFKFLSKPWDDDLLREQVREAFRYFEMAGENARLTAQLQAANSELSTLNRSLEQRVEGKTRELRLNIHALRISQAVLEDLPLAVIGIADDGVIAVANRDAHQLLREPSNGLVGQKMDDVLPATIVAACQESSTADGRNEFVAEIDGLPRLMAYCARLDANAHGAGTVLVLRPL